MERLPVIFRAERSDGTVTAVFPTMPGTYNPSTFTVYVHVGQHTTGTYPWYYKTRAAKPSEYAALLRELQGIYSSPNDPDAVELVIVRRFIARYDIERRKALER